MSIDTKTVYVPISETPHAPLQALGGCDAPVHTHAKLDRLGIWLSAICAVHCMVVPIVLIFFPVMSWIHWSRIMDVIVLSVAAIFGLGGCLLGLRHHRDAMPLSLVLIGLALNGTGRFAALRLGPVLAQTLIIAGPMIMAYGLWRDRQLCKCTNPAHAH
ncbi:MAG TPA: MerC domain-containing protein [Verrucomicrobiae bacterium]|nr:MerC domain-containing protein [Verrucomicrobiae bacterium]